MLAREEQGLDVRAERDVLATDFFKKCTALEEVSIAKLMAIAVAGLAAVRGASVLGARFFGFSSQAAKMVRALSRRIFRIAQPITYSGAFV